MKGTITVESSPGCGARFTVTVPVGEADASATPSAPMLAAAATRLQDAAWLPATPHGVAAVEPTASSTPPPAAERSSTPVAVGAGSFAAVAAAAAPGSGRRLHVLLVEDHHLNLVRH